MLPNERQIKKDYEIEYRYLDGAQRLIFEPMHDPDDHEVVLSSSSDLSFQVVKHPDGREEVKYLSPRRGAGRTEVNTAIDEKAGIVCRLPWQFAGVAYADLLQSRLLEWEQTDSRDEDSTAAFSVSRLAPQSFSNSNPDFLAMTGTIGFTTEPYWAVEAIDLKYVFKNGGDPIPGVRGKLSYRINSEGTKILDAVTWELLTSEGVSDRYTLDVVEMSFGTAHPDDFTLSGSGIKTVDTRGAFSNIPLLAWYAGAAALMCVAGMWLNVRHRRGKT